MSSRFSRSVPALLAMGLLALAVLPALGQTTTSDEPPLPENVVVDVDAIESQAVRIGIPDLLGNDGEAAANISRRDFELMPGFTVIDPRQITFNTEAAGLGINAGAWNSLGATGVIKGQLSTSNGRIQLDMKFYRMRSPGSPAVEQRYEGEPDKLRRFIHHFGNQVILTLTGTEGPFGTKLTYARREGPGRKDVMCAHMDGHNQLRVSNGRGIAMLPTFEPSGHIWFTRLTRTGMFITRSGMRGRRVVSGNGLNMAPSVCGDRIFFVSSRDGNSEIYSSDMEGGNIRRLTNNPAIDVSPACGPNNKVAFVSARHGSPQVWLMNQDGTGQERITFAGNHNQTPAFCPDPAQPLIAFTGRDQGLDIFTVNYRTREIVRLTQGQGANKDPAFSPDCRVLAFSSNRRRGEGLYLSSRLGFNQNRVVEGSAETIRWSTQRPTAD